MFKKIFSPQRKNLELPFSFLVLVSDKQALELPRATSHLCLSAAFTAFMQKCCSPGMINSILVLSAEWTTMINKGEIQSRTQVVCGESNHHLHSIRCFRPKTTNSDSRGRQCHLLKGLSRGTFQATILTYTQAGSGVKVVVAYEQKTTTN